MPISPLLILLAAGFNKILGKKLTNLLALIFWKYSLRLVLGYSKKSQKRVLKISHTNSEKIRIFSYKFMNYFYYNLYKLPGLSSYRDLNKRLLLNANKPSSKILAFFTTGHTIMLIFTIIIVFVGIFFGLHLNS